MNSVYDQIIFSINTSRKCEKEIRDIVLDEIHDKASMPLLHIRHAIFSLLVF
jgi:hypothetical protein